LLCWQVSLFRADALSTVVEVDKHLAIAHADEAAGLMFGVSAKHLLKKPFSRSVHGRTELFTTAISPQAACCFKLGCMHEATHVWICICRPENCGIFLRLKPPASISCLVCRLVGLPATTTFDDLLGKAAATAKKGAMKTAAGASGNAGGSRVGQAKHITEACHLADGKSLSLVLQVRRHAGATFAQCHTGFAGAAVVQTLSIK
jgi:hypothetical protein